MHDLVPDPPPDDPPGLLVTGDEPFSGDRAVRERERPKVGLVQVAIDDYAGGREQRSVGEVTDSGPDFSGAASMTISLTTVAMADLPSGWVDRSVYSRTVG